MAGDKYSCCAALSCAPGSVGLGPVLGLTTSCDQHKSAEVQPQTLQAGWQMEMVSCDMDRPSLGVTIKLLLLSLSKILG